MVLDHYGVPTAPFAVIHTTDANGEELESAEIEKMVQRSQHAEALSKYPLFAKPLAEGSSKGILSTNKIKSPADLLPVIRLLKSSSPSSDGALIETFLSGREFTVAILGTGKEAWILGVTEMAYTRDKDGNDQDSCSVQFTTEKSKQNDDWDGIVREIKADRADVQVQLACQSAMKAWQALRCRDGGRVDIRIDHSTGHPVACVLEVGPLFSLVHFFNLMIIPPADNVPD